VEDIPDVVIVGAGPAGAVAALRLAGAGVSVVCLEQGGWPDPGSYRGSAPDWELTSRKQWTSNPNIRLGAADYPVDISASDMSVGMYNGVGGGTVLFNAVWPRLLPEDFRTRSLEGVGDDWPVTYHELQSHYDRTDRLFGVSGLGGNPARPRDADPPLPPLPIGRGGHLVARAHARLGWNWWPDANAILSAPYKGRRPCVQRGTCAQGCNEGAKASADIAVWPDAIERGAVVKTAARVSRVRVDRRGLAVGVEWIDAAGHQHLQRASTVLLAANGIGTARLLLASTSSQFPDGIANSSGLVGKRLMLHPYVAVTGFFDEPLRSWQGHNGSAIGCWEFYRSDPSRGFVRGAKWSLHPTGGPLRIALPPNGTGVWGAEHHEYMSRRLGRGVTWIALCEDLPDEANRVVLTDAVDAAGEAVPGVVYRISDNVAAMMSWQAERAADSLIEAGAWRTESAVAAGNAHLLGTARMGDDPATSVVDRWGMAHDVANLGIIDGSVFVTAGAVNPTSTIAALALRCADHLVAQRGPGRATPPRSSARSSARRGDATSPAINEPHHILVAQSERDRFEHLAGALVPGPSSRLSPVQLRLGGDRLDEVLRARPDLWAPLRLILESAVGDAAQRVEAIRTSDPEAFAALATAVAGAYYLDPAVRLEIGYPGQEAISTKPDAYPDYIEEGLLDHMLRGDADRGTSPPSSTRD